MKKSVCLTLTIIIALFLVSCAGGSKEPGKLICGVTEFEPMNWRVDGNWTGFDTEFALLIGEKLGLDIEFQLIEWSRKFDELNSGAIDAIWNGFTATASEGGVPRVDLCDMSYSYMINTQCVIIRAARLKELKNIEDLIGKTIAVEAGSAGESKAKNLVGDTGTVVNVQSQNNSFMEVRLGTTDAAVVDIIKAQQLIDNGDYGDLVIAFELEVEVFAIGFRKGEPLRDKVNQAIEELYNDGTLLELAQKYDLDSKLVLDVSFGEDH